MPSLENNSCTPDDSTTNCIDNSDDCSESQISFRIWLTTKAKGTSNKICPIRSFIHHEQYNLTKGHFLDTINDLKNNVDQRSRNITNSAFYKHSKAIQVMQTVFDGKPFPKYPAGQYDQISKW